MCFFEKSPFWLVLAQPWLDPEETFNILLMVNFTNQIKMRFVVYLRFTMGKIGRNLVLVS